MFCISTRRTCSVQQTAQVFEIFWIPSFPLLPAVATFSVKMVLGNVKAKTPFAYATKHFLQRILISSYSMTFHNLFHDLFKFSITLRLAVTFKNFQNFPYFRVFFDLAQLTGTKFGVHQNVCRISCCFTSRLYITVHRPSFDTCSN